MKSKWLTVITQSDTIYLLTYFTYSTLLLTGITICLQSNCQCANRGLSGADDEMTSRPLHPSMSPLSPDADPKITRDAALILTA